MTTANREVSEKNNEIQNAAENQLPEILDSWLNQASQNTVPSLGDDFENMFSNFHKKPEETVEAEQHVGEKEKSLEDILPGVIRHTSSPQTPLAYYYSKKSGYGRFGTTNL